MKKIFEVLNKELSGDNVYNQLKKEYCFPCPVCDHISSKSGKKQSLAYNIETGKYQCWYCGLSGKPKINENIYASTRRFFNKIGKSSVVIDSTNYVKEKDINSIFKTNEEKSISVKIPYSYEALYDNVSSFLYKKAISYLESRRINEIDMLKYNIMYSYRDQRILFPSYDENLNLNYYVARSIIEDDVVKYQNPPVEKFKMIFNECFIDWDSEIYLVEGVFDYISAKRNAVPILGSYISKNSLLFKKLVANSNKIILALDPDATHKQEKIACALISEGLSVDYIDWNGETRDISAMGSDQFDIYCQENRRTYTDDYLLRSKIITKIRGFA